MAGFWTGIGIGIIIGALTGFSTIIILVRLGIWVIGAVI